MERQHFGGPFWENKPKPTSIDKELPLYEIPDDIVPEEPLDQRNDIPDVIGDFKDLKR